MLRYQRSQRFRGLGSLHPQLAVPRLAAAVCALLLTACFQFVRPGEQTSMRSAPSPSADEAYCAWYGSARGGVLFIGQPTWLRCLHYRIVPG